MSKVTDESLRQHRVVSRQHWISERAAFLKKEKAFSRQREQLAEERRSLPWEKVDKRYMFDGPSGQETLVELFGAQRQLVVYHFMFKPEADAGCMHCSFWGDHYSSVPVHLEHRDTSFVAISRAPLAKIEAFRKRMGWTFKWVSSGNTDFNYDYQASFTPAQLQSGTVFYNYADVPAGPADREGLSVFYKNDAGEVFHTYSSYARGIDMVNGTYQLLDLTPMGRNEAHGASMAWLKYHDRY
jgi:predicted dithiol-disulfide oxidoreductase (DUF899 family)